MTRKQTMLQWGEGTDTVTLTRQGKGLVLVHKVGGQQAGRMVLPHSRGLLLGLREACEQALRGLACKAIVAGGLVLLEPHDPRLLLRAWTPPAPAPRPQPAPPPARPAPPQRRPMRDDEEPRRIRARFASRCVVCGDGIEENERVWWRPGRGAWCLCHGEEVGL